MLRLRADGKKLTKEQVESTKPSEGVLSLSGYRLDGVPDVRYAATLRGGDSPGAMDLIPALYGATVRAIKGPNMLISGFEVHPRLGLPAVRSKQAWWVRVKGP